MVKVLRAVSVTAAISVSLLSCSSSANSRGKRSASGAPSAICGSKPVRMGMVVGASNSFLKLTYGEVKNKFANCSNVSVKFVTANNSADAYNAAVNALTAQGYDAIITDVQFGDQSLGALRAAYKAGLAVIPYINVPSGEPGKDFSTAVNLRRDKQIQLWGDWLNKTLNGQGNIVFLGGLPGAPLSQKENSSLKEELRVKAPGIKFLTDAAVTTNWDPAQEQQAVAGLISKYPKIDAVVSDYGGATMAAVRAFQAADVPVPPVVTTASTNEFGCAIADIRKTSPNFQFFSVDGVVRIPAVAGEKAVAAVNSGTKSGPSTDFTDFVVWDTTGSDPPKCDASLTPDADLSSTLTQTEMAAALK